VQQPTDDLVHVVADAERHGWRSRPVAWLLACGVLLAVLIALDTAVMLSSLRDKALADAKRELSNISLVLSEQVDRSFQAVELVQTNLLERLEASSLSGSEEFHRLMSGRDVHLMLRDRISGLSYIDSIAIFGARGDLVNFSRYWPIPPINIAELEHFSVLKADPKLASHLGRPVHNRSTGTWTIYLARKLQTADGRFLGIVVGGIELAYLEKSFAAIALSPESSISLFRSDGVLVVRHPRVEGTVGRSYPGLPDLLGGRDREFVRLVSKIDGRDRLIAFQRTANYPLVVAAGADIEVVLAEWARGAISILAAAGLLVTVIAGVIFLGARQMAARLRRQNLLFDAALNNMTQGVCMFGPDARLAVCNARYIQMYQLPTDKVQPGCTIHDLLALRKASGTEPGDLVRYTNHLLTSITEGKATTTIAQTTDGRIMSIVHQPMPDGGWVATHEDITERRRVEDRIAHLAHHDALTDLPNRVLLRERLEQGLQAIREKGQRFALLMLDLDRFKDVNDTLGHPAGDALLKDAAARLRGCVREADTVARLGGDEFAIVEGLTDPAAEAGGLAERVLEVMNLPFDFDGQQMTVSTSIGIAIAPTDGTDPDQLMKNADLALYRAKSEGRETYRFFEAEMDRRAQARRALESDLRTALLTGGLELHYQPFVDLERDEVSGFEALLRWNHPQRGAVSPAEFVPIAEETGLIGAIGEWVLKQACRDAAAWPGHIKVAVNLSPAQFKCGDPVEAILAALSESGVAASRLEVEITESVMLQESAATLATLRQLHDTGVRIALDDFGTGYSSLSYLRSFPFDKIKIDGSFIRNVSDEESSLAIIRAVTGLSKSLGMVTTAEGVETVAQFERVRSEGCTQAQGYLIGRPRPASELGEFLAAFRLKSVAAA
jgi:diguanylate cyclase (GGDEF)-like protein